MNNDIDFCNECNAKSLIKCCDKCGEGVCANDNCSLVFPYHRNTNYILCRTCSDKIESKLKVVIDLDKLRLLKQKIDNKRTKKQTMNKNIY
jgi:hypothetical protein